jgi:tetratricopeptide (TPR) repeat protein
VNSLTRDPVRLARLGAATAALAAAGTLPARASAQSLPLKRAAPAPTAIACPVFTPPPTPVREQMEEANRLGTLGRESSLEGDHKAARELFRQAAQLNPADAALAYRLGRESDESADTATAVREYCRYLALAPTAGDASGVREQLARLLPAGAIDRGTAIAVQFQTGATRYDAGDWDPAAESFGAVTAAEPGYAPAWYNQALALGRAHHQVAAVRAFDQYLLLAPDATDRSAVREEIRRLRDELPHAGTAFAIGLLPGGGQYYTGQIPLGLVVTAGAAGGVVWALTTQTVTKLHHYVDENGVPYTEPYQASEHSHLGAGLAIAGGVTLFGAIEAAIVAHHRSAELPPPDTTTSASIDRAHPVLAWALPTVEPARDGLHVGLPLHVAF